MTRIMLLQASVRPLRSAHAPRGQGRTASEAARRPQ
jgi:hypothetical protein